MTHKGKNIVVVMDPELEELIPNYLENRHRDVQSIVDARVQGDFEAIRLLAHSMKGSGGGYGFDAITDIGQSMEQAAKAGNGEEISKWAQELQVYLDHVEVVYE